MRLSAGMKPIDRHRFGVKVSIVTINARAPGGQFVIHAKALPGNQADEFSVAIDDGRCKKWRVVGSRFLVAGSLRAGTINH